MGIIGKNVPVKFACVLSDGLALHEQLLYRAIDVDIVCRRVSGRIEEDNQQWPILGVNVHSVPSRVFCVPEQCLRQRENTKSKDQALSIFEARKNVGPGLMKCDYHRSFCLDRECGVERPDLPARHGFSR